MRISGDWLARRETQAVAAALEDAGYEARFVGGCVRDTIVGRPVVDIDVATNARPEAVQIIAEAAGLKVKPTGLDHGTVTVISNGLPHEVTTYRRDIRTDGRHAVVEYAEDFTEDARRRDFTFNALYADRDGELSDPVGGLPDLRAGQVRFIENADERIREDFLRILRFFRFLAHFGNPNVKADPDAVAACERNAVGLERVSAERVGQEMMKLLSAADPGPALRTMDKVGILQRVLPEADAASIEMLVHLEGDLPPDPVRRLAALGGDRVPDRLRLSRAETRRLGDIKLAAQSNRSPGELGYRLGLEDGRSALLVRVARAGEYLAEDALETLRKGAVSRFPVRASDLMPALTGASLGKRLDQLEQRWIASEFQLGRDDLLS